MSRQSIFSSITPSPDSRGIGARGFTLVELMVALGVGAIVLTVIYSAYGGLTRSYTTQNAAADMQQVMRAGIDFMVEDIIRAGLNPNEAPGFGIAVANSTTIRFLADRNMNGTANDTDFEEITYRYIPADNRLEQCVYETVDPPGDCEDFIDDVTDLTFTYLDEDGTVMANPTANLSDIRSVGISLTVQKPAGRDGMISRTYSTRIRCRNLGI